MSLTSDSDEVLIGRHLRGDSTAFELLYRRHEMRTWRYLERSIGIRASADELMQDLWFAVAKDAARFQPTVRFATWLFSIVYTRISEVAQAVQPAAVAGEPSTLMTRALGQLSSERRGAFLLQMEGELSIEEIAAITNSSLDGIEGQLHQARADLHDLLPQVTPGQDKQGDVESVDDRYRHASAIDASRPSEWVRRKVLAHAARLAAERVIKSALAARTMSGNSLEQPAVSAFENRTSLRSVIWVAVATAALGGFLGAWHFLPPRQAVAVALVPTQVINSDTGSSPGAGAPVSDRGGTERRAESESLASEAAGSQSVDPSGSPVAIPSQAVMASVDAQPSAPVLAASAVGAPEAPAALVQSSSSSGTSPITEASTTGSSTAWVTDADAAASVTTSTMTGDTSGVEDTNSATASPPRSPNALWRAAEMGDVRGLKAAFAERIDINSRNAEGRTALMLAVRHGQTNAVRELLAHGADPNVADDHGTTPLHAATAAGNSSIIVTLKRAGAR
jgi:RNA polymerase sigma-70 factor, ECF subfamily